MAWPCPVHKGRDKNFAVNAETGQWFCHSQCGRGGSVYDLEMAFTKADFRTAAVEVQRIANATVAPSAAEPTIDPKWGLTGWQQGYLRQRIEEVEAQNGWKFAAMYPYFESNGRFSYVKVRFFDKQNDKTFRQYALSPKGGWVSRKKAKKTPILYRLNTLADADEVFIVNGEKAAERGTSELGIVTTCAPDGEGNWSGEYTKWLVAKAVCIVVDRDEKGEKHGQTVAEAIAPHAREVRILRLPGLPPKGDLWDWINAGGTRQQLNEIVKEAPTFQVLAMSPTETSAAAINVAVAREPETLLTQFRNDTGNAERLIVKFGDRIRYCPPFRKWLVWDGRRWRVDDPGAVRRLAKGAMKAYLREATDAEDRDHMAFACSSLDARRIANMLTMAECDLVVTPEQLVLLCYKLLTRN